MISYPPRPAELAIIVDLARYRTEKEFSAGIRRKGDQEFCAAFAIYLRSRAARAETDPDGLKRMAVAFSLRRIRLVKTLMAMLDEQYLRNSAAIALDLTERLDDILANPAGRASSASPTAHQLALALAAVADALETPPSSAHSTRR